MKIERIFLVYLIGLGLMTFFSMQSPSLSASFVHFFLPIKTDFAAHAFIRYRMILFITATLIFLILAPIVLYKGIYGVPRLYIKRNANWRHFITAIIALPIGWLGYPFIALCTTCWTANDIFYFFVTASFFVAMHLFLYTIVFKIIR